MMSETDLICNFKKCRKKLTAFAWVTACSHVFCDEDGTREFARSFTCPACEANLTSKSDLIRVDLNPTEQYKSMVLAGQKPEAILEICSRAISFWMYQTQQEKAYQEFVATRAKERNVQLEQYYEQILIRTKTELTTSKKELDTLKKKHHELSEQFSEKGRQFQKLQSQYEHLKRKHINPQLLQPELDIPKSNRSPFPGFNLSLGGDVDHELLRRAHELEKSFDTSNNNRTTLHSPAKRDFVFRPQQIPLPSADSTISSLFNFDNFK